MPQMKSRLTDWLNIAITLIGIASLVFIAGRKDKQLEDLVTITSDMAKIQVTTLQDVAAIKERLNALERSR